MGGGGAVLGDILYQCFKSLDTYGRTASSLPDIQKAFMLVLGEYPTELVHKGFVKWLTRESRFPTPADIVNLIDPLPKPWKPDWAVYVALKSKITKDGYYPWQHERDFMRRCEDFAMLRGSGDTVADDSLRLPAPDTVQ